MFFIRPLKRRWLPYPPVMVWGPLALLWMGCPTPDPCPFFLRPTLSFLHGKVSILGAPSVLRLQDETHSCFGQQMPSVRLVDPNNDEVPVTLSRSFEDEVGTYVVAFTPKEPGAYHLTVQFERGNVQDDLLVYPQAPYRRGFTVAGQVKEILRSALGTPLLIRSPLVRSPYETLIVSGLSEEVRPALALEWAAPARSGDVVWSGVDGGVGRLVESAAGDWTVLDRYNERVPTFTTAIAAHDSLVLFNASAQRLTPTFDGGFRMEQQNPKPGISWTTGLALKDRVIPIWEEQTDSGVSLWQSVEWNDPQRTSEPAPLPSRPIALNTDHLYVAEGDGEKRVMALTYEDGGMVPLAHSPGIQTAGFEWASTRIPVLTPQPAQVPGCVILRREGTELKPEVFLGTPEYWCVGANEDYVWETNVAGEVRFWEQTGL